MPYEAYDAEILAEGTVSLDTYLTELTTAIAADRAADPRPYPMWEW